MKRSGIFFWIGAALFLAAAFLMTKLVGNQYPFFAGYVILQFMVLAVAWSILGGHAGYVNFGTSAFFGIGVYTAVFLVKAFGAPLVVQIAAAAAIGALMGFALGFLTLRMQGIFFSIATIALTIVIETSITNWRYVGGAAGIQLQRPMVTEPFNNYVQMLFFVQALLVVLAVAISRYIQNSWIGRGLQALRDDELAAECTGVPTLRLKLTACVISGALMCAAGAPAAMYLQYADPASAFNLNYSVSVLAMSLDRRHRALGGPDRRRDPARHHAATADRHYLVGSQRAGARRDAGGVRGRRAGGDHRPGPKGSPAMSMTPEPQAPLLRIAALTKRFGGFTALDNVSVEIRPGERFGLIGPNGSGKTTLINCISGAFRTEPGTVVFRDEDITPLPPHTRTRRGIARSFQIPRPFRSMTVAENLMVALDFAAHELVSESRRRDTMMSILARMGLESKANAPTTKLSQVELRKMELARAMATHPKLLISDEAMAGLSSSEVDEVLDLLMSFAREDITIIMIEHIMQAVMRFSDRVMCLDAGRIIAIGTPAEVMADRRVQEAYLGT